MEFEMLATGYGLLEAPRVDDIGRFYFTDIPNGGIYRRNPGGNVETLIPKRKGSRIGRLRIRKPLRQARSVALHPLRFQRSPLWLSHREKINSNFQ